MTIAYHLNQNYNDSFVININQALAKYQIMLIKDEDRTSIDFTSHQVGIAFAVTTSEDSEDVVGIGLYEISDEYKYKEPRLYQIAQDLTAISPVLMDSYTPATVLDYHFYLPENNMQHNTQNPILINLVAGIALYMVGDCEAAEEYFTVVSEDANEQPHPDDLYRYISFFRANCRILMGEYQQAIELLALYLPEDEQDWLMHKGYINNLAWLYVQANQDDKARYLITRLVELSKNKIGEETTLARAARFYALLFDYETALTYINQALNLIPPSSDILEQHTRADLHTIRGEIYLLLYEWHNALADFDTAVELAPEYADAYFYRGLTHYTLVNREAALQDFERYLELAPEGFHAAQAQQSIESIRIELQALNR
jgi:tetratricopeptide (TPR) repeat protein